MDPSGRRSPTPLVLRAAAPKVNTHQRDGDVPLRSVSSCDGHRPYTEKRQWRRMRPQKKKKNGRQHLKPRSRRHLHSHEMPTESISPSSGSSRPLPALRGGRAVRVLETSRGLFVWRRAGPAPLVVTPGGASLFRRRRGPVLTLSPCSFGMVTYRHFRPESFILSCSL